MKRIIKISQVGSDWFVPQQCLNGVWQEFFGYDEDSPYLRAKTFRSLGEAKKFLSSPAIFKGEVVA